MSIHDSIRINELNSELAALKDKLVMTVEAWETTTNSFINFYVSEREARFVFSTLESRDAFMKVMIGAENTIDNATAEDVARHRAEIKKEGVIEGLVTAAHLCYKITKKRSIEYGKMEPDTGAIYYEGELSNEYELRDEEDGVCALTINEFMLVAKRNGG